MTETAKPLWWRIGKAKWHFSTWHPWPVVYGLCGRWTAHEDIPGIRDDLCVRYDEPPVADQCKRCRAAKAKQKGASK